MATTSFVEFINGGSPTIGVLNGTTREVSPVAHSSGGSVGSLLDVIRADIDGELVSRDPVSLFSVAGAVSPTGTTAEVSGCVPLAKFQGQLGVIVGRSARDVSETDALSYVWGYTITSKWAAGEASACLGPVAVPKDRFPADAALTTSVNGVPVSTTDLADVIAAVPGLVATASAGNTLAAGTVVAATSAANGELQAGDIVQVSVTGVASVLTQLVAVDEPSRAAPAGLTKVGTKHLYVETGGPDDAAETIVFIHGSGCNSTYYKDLIRRAGLDQVFRIVLVDLDGFGQSPTTPGLDGSMEAYAMDVVNVILSLGVSRATLVGHSMGCGISQIIAVKFPDLAAKMILLAPIEYPLAPDVAPVPVLTMNKLREHGVYDSCKNMLQYSTSAATREQSPWAVFYLTTLLMANDAEGYARSMKALSVQSSIDIGATRQPTLIIAGQYDNWPTVAQVNDMAAQMHNTTVEVIPDIGHWIHIEAPERAAELVRAFML
ncbi:Alpha/Beta hydrolase protein [Dipodascopsis tothii]|uniref:Alpha/Beta hydrolase protein n=1 Tax=Dipodascopsis tothii TaxID=44089 RepID=UPI0034CF6D88